MSGGSGADFMIHGIVKYHLFGHELWLTTTTVGMTIVTIVLLILVIAANRALKHATDVPGTFQNIIEFGMEMLENMTTGIHVSPIFVYRKKGHRHFHVPSFFPITLFSYVSVSRTRQMFSLTVRLCFSSSFR